MGDGHRRRGGSNEVERYTSVLVGRFGTGKRSQDQRREAAHWVSWAEPLEMVLNRHSQWRLSPEQSFEALRICERFVYERQFPLGKLAEGTTFWRCR